jgi:hypothetical protein
MDRVPRVVGPHMTCLNCFHQIDQPGSFTKEQSSSPIHCKAVLPCLDYRPITADFV